MKPLVDLAHVLLGHVGVVVLEVEADGRNQADRLQRESVDEQDDLPAHPVVAALGPVLADLLEVVVDRAVRDDDGGLLRLKFDPVDEARQPALVLSVNFFLAALANLRHICW